MQIFSAVERIKELTGGRIAGVPLKLVLRSYKTNHNGQAALQSGVSLEFRAEDFESVRKNLIEQSYKFRLAAGLPERAPVRMIESSDGAFEESPISAQAMAGEFYPDNEEDSDSRPASTTNAPAAQTASAAKVAEIGEALAKPAPRPADASNVVPISADKAPWAGAEKPRVRMTEMFTALLKEIGKPDYDRLLAEYGMSTGARIDIEKAETLACYRAMEKLRDERAKVAVPSAVAEQSVEPETEKPLF